MAVFSRYRIMRLWDATEPRVLSAMLSNDRFHGRDRNYRYLAQALGRELASAVETPLTRSIIVARRKRVVPTSDIVSELVAEREISSAGTREPGDPSRRQVLGGVAPPAATPSTGVNTCIPLTRQSEIAFWPAPEVSQLCHAFACSDCGRIRVLTNPTFMRGSPWTRISRPRRSS